MKIILEGPDNAGKTTLANNLRAALGDEVMYYHPGGAPTDIAHEMRCITDQLKALSTHKRIIMDRITPISQRVYNPDPKDDVLRASAMEGYYNAGVTFIYCRPSTDKLLRVQDLTWRDGESDEHREKIIRGQHKFIERYDEIMRKVPCLSYNFEDRELSDVMVKKCIQAMQGSHEAIAWFYNLVNYRIR